MERMPPATRSRAGCTSLVWSWMARSSHAGLSHSIETSAVALRGSRAASWVRMPCVIERDRADPPNHCGFHRSETTAMAPRRITFVVGLAVVEALAHDQEHPASAALRAEHGSVRQARPLCSAEWRHHVLPHG